MGSETLKEKVKKGQVVMGTWCVIPSEHTANIIAKAGLDFVIIDMEHGAMDFEKALSMTMAVQAEGCSSIIRVPYLGESPILRALELGADGIIVPHIESGKDARDVARYSKYHPLGSRGFSPYTRSGCYHSSQEHTARENERVLTAIMVENPKSVEDIEAIISDPAIDAVYIGTYDVSCALGIPGQVNDRRVMELLKESVKRIRKAGKAAACMGNSKEEIEALKEMGVQILLYGVDAFFMYDSYDRMRKNSPK